MSKVYSNKALPPGTVLREWRLEEVLGVGGFGIVYKARGIYFDELVAIKEYFPSSISERQEDDTIVPVDSDAEEVHALGLKKFVEEAKLLWNLSTPSRHPNIVSVRSLFEIHGSAYMVMDFEDGVSLSRLLKDGTRYNQASLTALILPIAEGLERAHRVGVLHRDIKPANILVGPDGRPVLIDFGSARFESGEATSTTVTFHTPPYAAIEQYVKTYEQGPWTDIYALGVVLYECVVGEKPAEVLERLHGSSDQPLLARNLAGFSRSFLSAIDAAMTIRPDERPRSISDWLALFDRPESELSAPPSPAADDSGDATRVATFVAPPNAIRPVAPPIEGFESAGVVETGVPDRPSGAEFKRAGVDTIGEVAEPPAGAEPPPPPPPPPPPSPRAARPSAGKPLREADKAAGAAKRPTAGASAKPEKPASTRPLVLAGIGVAALALIGGGWLGFGYLLGGQDSGQTESPGGPGSAIGKAAIARVASEEGYAKLVQGLADEAAGAGQPGDAVADLEGAAERIAALEKEIADAPRDGPVMLAKRGELQKLMISSLSRFVTALSRNVDARSRRLAGDLKWADPARVGAAAREGRQKQDIAATLRRSREALGTAVEGFAGTREPAAALALAQQALSSAKSFGWAATLAYRAGTTDAGSLPPEQAKAGPAMPGPATTPAPQVASEPEQSAGVAMSTRREFDSAVSSAKDIAQQVIRLGDAARPGANASDDEKAGFRLRQYNAKTARSYQDYLNTLARSMEATTTDQEARQSIAKARQTLGYLSSLLRSQKAALD